MKKEILLTVNRFMRKVFTVTIMVGVLVISNLPLTADAQKFSFEKSNPEISYLGTLEDKLLFQIDLESVTDSPLLVYIKDNDGNILFSEKVKSKTFSRKFAFNKEEFEGRKVTFVIQGGKESSVQTFQVARNMRFVENVVITKVQ